MGKWSPEYQDEVLGSKITHLVSGAIKRVKLDKTDPAISYEEFVQDLDTGDSFTTTLIEILVKELAERRHRQKATDRRLISESTAKSLRLLATPLRIYRERSYGRNLGRRTVNLTDYLSAPPDEMDMDEDDDEFESMLEGSSAVEGARVNAELYDAYGHHSWTHPSSLRRNHSYSTVVASSEETSPLIPPSLPSPPIPNRANPWSLPPGAATSLTRHSSIRRLPRSRTGDFSDFTSRRRSTIRELQGSRPDAEASASDSWGNHDPSWNRNPSARRFFPFTIPNRAPRFSSSIPPAMPWSESQNGEGSEESGAYGVTDPSPSSGAWYALPTPVTTASSSQTENASADSNDEAPPTPRLRRGGLRAPESILSRHASPITIINPTSFRIFTPEPTENESGDQVAEPAATYPTPGSTDNEASA